MSWWRRLLKREEMEQHLDAELRFHFDGLVADNVRAGMSEPEARRSARLKFGGVEQVKEECRDARGTRWVEDLLLDLGFALRWLRARSPGFASTVIICLALAIGANTAIFSLIDEILLNPLPYPNAGRLVILWTTSRGNRGTANGVSVPDYVTWSAQNRSFEAIGSTIALSSDLGKQENGSPAERVHGQAFSSTMFQVLGVRPILGRFFTEDEDKVDGSSPVALISYNLWQRQFGAKPDILGERLRVDSEDLTIVGVMPQHFSFLDDECDYWRPAGFSHFQLQGSSRFLTVAARLKEGISVDQAQSDMTRIAIDLGHIRPRTDAGCGLSSGLVGAALLTSLISQQLWGGTPTDSATLVEVSGLLGTIALIACLIPAYRALRIDPITAVRCE